jgi:hypothetical protein
MQYGNRFLVCQPELGFHINTAGLYKRAVESLDMMGCHDYNMAISQTIKL